MRFARHKAELDDGEAADDGKDKAGVAERAEIRLHCKRHEEVGDCACHGEKRDEFCERDAVMQETQGEKSGDEVPGEVAFVPVERHGGDGAPPFSSHDFPGVGDARTVHLADCSRKVEERADDGDGKDPQGVQCKLERERRVLVARRIFAVVKPNLELCGSALFGLDENLERAFFGAVDAV